MGADTANLMYLLAALLVVGGAAYGAHRNATAVGAKGPGPLVSVFIWLALIALVAAIWFGAQFWSALFSTVS